MYVIINKTERRQYHITGHWPEDFVEHMIRRGDDIIVISTYSNTIKIPGKLSEEYEDEREWTEYGLYEGNIRITK